MPSVKCSVLPNAPFQVGPISFEQVLEIEPDHAHAIFHLGLIHERLGDVAEAAAR